MDPKQTTSSSTGGGFFASIASSLSNFGSAVSKSVNGPTGIEIEGLEVVNPEGGTEDAEEEAKKGRWKEEERDSYWKMMQKYVGSDITSMVTLPVIIFEPMTMIQKMAELMEYSYLLDMADETDDPYMRLVYASSFFISVYYAYQRTWKPFNPILGETYEMANHGGMSFIAEQVSHHPPMSAGHAENEHFTYDVTSKLKTKFLGNSVDVYPVGRTRVTLKRDGVTLDLVPPPTKVSNLIFGRTWIDSPGEMVLTNLTTGDKVVLYFQPCGWFGLSFQGNCLKRNDTKQRPSKQCGGASPAKSQPVASNQYRQIADHARKHHGASEPTWLLALEIVAGTMVGFLFLVAALATIQRCNNKSSIIIPWRKSGSLKDHNAVYIDPEMLKNVRRYSRQELEEACEDFNNIIGSSPDSVVYKGTMKGGPEIAVISLCIKEESWTGYLELYLQREVAELAKLNHEKTGKLVGYCRETNSFSRMLVFDYASNGTLHEHLHCCKQLS